jgi:hypothetical protein
MASLLTPLSDPTSLNGVTDRINSLVARIGSSRRGTLPHSRTNFDDLLACWLTRPEFSLPEGSVVGLLCSEQLSSELGDVLDAGFLSNFRAFVFSSSLSYSGWKDRDVSLRDLCHTGRRSGSALVQQLDRILTPQFLARLGQDSARAMLLVVLGIVIGVAYAEADADSPPFPADAAPASADKPTTLWVAMKEHLCQMLAHHLVFLGSMAGVKFSTEVEQQIIDTAVNRWNKHEVNMWADMLNYLEPTDGVAPVGEEPLKMIDGVPTANDKLVAAACHDANELNRLTAWEFEEGAAYAANPSSYLFMDEDPVQFDNPASYLEMDDDDFPLEAPPEWTADPPPPYSEAAGEGSEVTIADFGTSSFRLYSISSQTQAYHAATDESATFNLKRRSVWVVRPFESEGETVNVKARFRVQRGQGLGLFP